MLLNGTRKAKFLDLASSPHIHHYPHRVHVAEENCHVDCSHNTQFPELTVCYRANLIHSCVVLGIGLAKS
jgi:hypothetical protein